MIRRRALVLLLSLTITVAVSNTLSTHVQSAKYSKSYPTVVCPPSDSSVVSQTSLTSSSTKFRKITGKNTALQSVSNLKYKSDGSAILLDQPTITSITWQGLSGVWAGATLCRAPQSDQWFVGGSANVFSKGRIYLVNSGLSDALVDVALWNGKGALASKVFPVHSNSTLRIALDSIAAGSDQLVIRVTPRSGRVSSYLVEERSKGLRSLGGDIVNATDSPGTDLIISGIPHQRSGGKGISHVVRLLVPGNVDAHVRVDLISTDGVFAPVGLDGVDIAHGIAKDLAFTPTIASTIFSLRIRSDQPMVAGVFSALNVNSHTDIVWNAVSPTFAPMTLGVRGLNPTLVFTGDSISVQISARMTTGKVLSTRLNGNDIAAWRVPNDVSSVSLSASGAPIVGSALVSSNSGVAAFPLLVGSELTKALVPNSDIAVINR
ncbi:MAG: DUF5719 family protein [Actinobacteria bacterium]|nr:DUF5719 family protein [Actinomycetota bacterium]